MMLIWVVQSVHKSFERDVNCCEFDLTRGVEYGIMNRVEYINSVYFIGKRGIL